MGQLVNGEWVQTDVRQGKENAKGEFLRKPVTFRNQVEPGGTFPPEAQRYHLYVSFACPWAHRTLIMRQLKGLSELIPFSVVSPWMLNDGWSFKKDFDSVPEDPVNKAEFLREIYIKADARFTGRVTVPILWDKKQNTIVNNESSEIIRIFNTQFNELTGNFDDYYPEPLRNQIDEWNERIYNSVNNGVYRCGFATSQEAYNEAYRELFERLNELDDHLKNNKWLCGDTLTEADLRLFPTLIRFDSVYHTHFKCNGKLIAEYDGLSRFTNSFLKLPGIAETVNMDHIKQHYYYSHETINPSRIVPNGPLKKD